MEEVAAAAGGSAAAAGGSAPITSEGDMPQKKFYRSRAHCNPLSFNETFDYPTRPDSPEGPLVAKCFLASAEAT